MRYSVLQEHRERVFKTGRVEFEELLSEEECRQFAAIPAGRDPSTEHPPLRKIVVARRFAEIAAELLQVDGVYLGYDERIDSSSGEFTLAERSGFQGVLGGFLFCLVPSDTEDAHASSVEAVIRKYPLRDDEDIPPPPPKLTEEEVVLVKGIPETVGSALFITADFPLKIPADSGRYLLICYVGKRSRYVQNPRDPYNQKLKYSGFVFGDALPAETHPLLVRKRKG